MSFPFTVSSPYPVGNSYYCRSGPFPKNSTTRYAVGFGTNSSQATNTLAVLKTTDNGPTWNPLDEIHAPAFTVGPNYSSCFDGVNTLWINYSDDLNNLWIVSFDISTDLWGTPISSGITLGALNNNYQVTNCWRSADSKVAMLIQNGSVTVAGSTVVYTCQFLTFDPTGPTFSSTTTLDTTSSGFASTGGHFTQFPYKIVEGASGIIHCTSWMGSSDNAFTTGDPLLFQSIDLTNTLDTIQALAYQQPFQTFLSVVWDMVYDSTSGLVTIPYIDYWDGSNYIQNIIQVLQATSGPNPSFTVAGTIDRSAFVSDIVTIGVASTGGTLDLFWVDDSTSYKFYLSTNLGSPTMVGSTSIFPSLIQAILYSSVASTYGILFSSNYWELISGTPVIVTCPLGSIPVLTPYDHFITATGGTGPYTYVITGSLPPGLAQVGSTGEITGTPTVAGIYMFTVVATDSLGAMSDPTNCGIAVSSSAPGRYCVAQA